MLKLIFWVVVGLLALSFFGISLRSLVESPQTQDNFSFMAALLTDGWHHIQAFFGQVTSGAAFTHH